MRKADLRVRLAELQSSEQSLVNDINFIHGQMALIQEILGGAGLAPLLREPEDGDNNTN